jgi:hypothetical protein
MTSAHSAYIRRATATSLLVNVTISAVMTWVVFSRSAAIFAWGVHGFALDFLPQTFMISLMSILAPGFAARKDLAAGRIAAMPNADSIWPATLRMRGFIWAIIATTALVGISFAAVVQFQVIKLSFNQLLVIKILYGALATLLVTPVGLRATLATQAR